MIVSTSEIGLRVHDRVMILIDSVRYPAARIARGDLFDQLFREAELFGLERNRVGRISVARYDRDEFRIRCIVQPSRNRRFGRDAETGSPDRWWLIYVPGKPKHIGSIGAAEHLRFMNNEIVTTSHDGAGRIEDTYVIDGSSLKRISERHVTADNAGR